MNLKELNFEVDSDMLKDLSNKVNEQIEKIKAKDRRLKNLKRDQSIYEEELENANELDKEYWQTNLEEVNGEISELEANPLNIEDEVNEIKKAIKNYIENTNNRISEIEEQRSRKLKDFKRYQARVEAAIEAEQIWQTGIIDSINEEIEELKEELENAKAQGESEDRIKEVQDKISERQQEKNTLLGPSQSMKAKSKQMQQKIEALKEWKKEDTDLMKEKIECKRAIKELEEDRVPLMEDCLDVVLTDNKKIIEPTIEEAQVSEEPELEEEEPELEQKDEEKEEPEVEEDNQETIKTLENAETVEQQEQNPQSQEKNAQKTTEPAQPIVNNSTAEKDEEVEGINTPDPVVPGEPIDSVSIPVTPVTPTAVAQQTQQITQSNEIDDRIVVGIKYNVVKKMEKGELKGGTYTLTMKSGKEIIIPIQKSGNKDLDKELDELFNEYGIRNEHFDPTKIKDNMKKAAKDVTGYGKEEDRDKESQKFIKQKKLINKVINETSIIDPVVVAILVSLDRQLEEMGVDENTNKAKYKKFLLGEAQAEGDKFELSYDFKGIEKVKNIDMKRKMEYVKKIAKTAVKTGREDILENYKAKNKIKGFKSQVETKQQKLKGRRAQREKAETQQEVEQEKEKIDKQRKELLKQLNDPKRVEAVERKLENAELLDDLKTTILSSVLAEKVKKEDGTIDKDKTEAARIDKIIRMYNTGRIGTDDARWLLLQVRSEKENGLNPGKAKKITPKAQKQNSNPMENMTEEEKKIYAENKKALTAFDEAISGIKEKMRRSGLTQEQVDEFMSHIHPQGSYEEQIETLKEMIEKTDMGTDHSTRCKILKNIIDRKSKEEIIRIRTVQEPAIKQDTKRNYETTLKEQPTVDIYDYEQDPNSKLGKATKKQKIDIDEIEQIFATPVAEANIERHIEEPAMREFFENGEMKAKNKTAESEVQEPQSLGETVDDKNINRYYDIMDDLGQKISSQTKDTMKKEMEGVPNLKDILSVKYEPAESEKTDGISDDDRIKAEWRALEAEVTENSIKDLNSTVKTEDSKKSKEKTTIFEKIKKFFSSFKKETPKAITDGSEHRNGLDSVKVPDGTVDTEKAIRDAAAQVKEENSKDKGAK